MIEVVGDLFGFPANARCITTNGAIRKDGAAVMGRGVAEQAKALFPGIEYILGGILEKHGNHVSAIYHVGIYPLVQPRGLRCSLLSFPVKDHWRDRARFDLIRRSALELVEMTNDSGWEVVALPRPGCGNGGRRWGDVQALIEDILDDRFVIVERSP